MTRDQIQTDFVRLFATRTHAVANDEIAWVEAELVTTFPDSYLRFITKFGAIFTPSILDLVTGGETEIAPEGASWDVREFFKGAELINVAKGNWLAGMEPYLVPIAMDCMGNVFGFRRGIVDPRPADSPVLFFLCALASRTTNAWISGPLILCVATPHRNGDRTGSSTRKDRRASRADRRHSTSLPAKPYQLSGYLYASCRRMGGMRYCNGYPSMGGIRGGRNRLRVIRDEAFWNNFRGNHE